MMSPTDDSGQLDIKLSEERNIILLSFAPSSGIGFYLSKDKTHYFDIVNNQDTALDTPQMFAAIRQQWDQLHSGACFKDIESMHLYVNKEYLRDKKNTYYFVALCKKITTDLKLEILDFLQHNDL